jgi:serine/threonine protein kinase
VSVATAPWVEVTAGSVRWQLLPECRDRLLGPGGLRLEEWLHAGQAQVVKHGPHRTVYQVHLPGLQFHLKHYRLMDTRAWLRQLARPPKARMEYDRALAVAARRIPTIMPLGLGEDYRNSGSGDSYLVTRSLDGTEPLNRFLETTLATFPRVRQLALRQHVAKELGRFLARMHDAGIVHRDLHAGNLLICLEPGDRLALFLIDLHAVRLGPPLKRASALANLAIFNRWFILRASCTDRLRFWHAYCQARCHDAPRGAPITRSVIATVRSTPRSDDCGRALGRALEQRTWTSNLHFWRRRDRRCLATNRYYERLRSPGAVGHAVRDLDRDTVAALLADPDEPFRRRGAKFLKNSASSTVVEFAIPVNGAMVPVIYKRFRVTTWSDPWLALVRRTPAVRSWVHGHGLRERFLPTARPLAVIHRRSWGLAHEGYLLTEKIPAAVDLATCVAALKPRGNIEHRRSLHILIDHVARLVRELHRRRLSHRDLKAVNVLVQKDEGGKAASSPHRSFGPIWLIDLVGVKCYRRLPRSRRLQNLARLHASFLQSPCITRTDKLRFLRTYLQWGLLGKGTWKKWWLQINRVTLAKVARNARAGRPLA